MSIELKIPAWAGPVASEDVAASCGESRFSVAAEGWRDLPAEIVELLAPQVLVSTRGVDREPDDEPLGPPVDEPCAGVRAWWSRRRI